MNFLRGSGFRNFNGLIEAIESGEIGAREVGPIRTLRETRKKQRTLEVQALDPDWRPTAKMADAPPEVVEEEVSEARRFRRNSRQRKRPVASMFAELPYYDTPLKERLRMEGEGEESWQGWPVRLQTIIHMSPDEYLDMALSFKDQAGFTHELDYKEESIRDAVEQGHDLPTPQLYFEMQDNGVAKIMDHEGRHRARVMRELGFTTMPVLISSNARIGSDYRIDGGWPSVLEGQQNENQIPFPVADPLID